MSDITEEELQNLQASLKPLIGLRLSWLSLPQLALIGFEPSQVAVIVNTLLDGVLPQIELLASDEENLAILREIGFKKAPGLLGQREGYPDYIHISGKRVELKGHFVDNSILMFKRPPTKREPSARLKENITLDIIQPENDALLIAAVQLVEEDGFCSPVIVDLGVFSMVECIRARDKRLLQTGGRFINNQPKVISVKGFIKLRNKQLLSDADYERDTNFGKLKRIPYKPLQDFLLKWS
jgi:hypothetical protein